MNVYLPTLLEPSRRLSRIHLHGSNTSESVRNLDPELPLMGGSGTGLVRREISYILLDIKFVYLATYSVLKTIVSSVQSLFAILSLYPIPQMTSERPNCR